VQQVLNLLDQLQQRMKLTYLFISHGPGAIRCICDHIAQTSGTTP
jgi:ABC-type glutathione transport system ATPase component